MGWTRLQNVLADRAQELGDVLLDVSGALATGDVTPAADRLARLQDELRELLNQVAQYARERAAT